MSARRPFWLVVAVAAGCGGKAEYRVPQPDGGHDHDAAALDAGDDAAPDAAAIDAGVDSGCHDDLDQDGVDSPACGGNDCNDADPTIKPRAEDPGEWLFERADELGWAVAPSVAVGADAVPHVLFEDRTAHAVVDAVRVGEEEWARTVVEAGGRAPAAAIGSDGLLHAVFVTGAADQPSLRHAVLDSGAWELETALAGAADRIPGRPSLAAGAGELLVAAFSEEGAGGAVVRIAERAAGAWTVEDVAADGGPVEAADGPVALALDAADVPWLAWEASATIRVATRAGDAWAIEVIPLAGAASAPDVAVAADGVVVASYFDRSARALGVAKRTDGAWSSELVDDRHGAGAVSALAVDATGAAQVLYYAPDRFDTRWATDAYEGWLIVTVDRSSEADVSITIDPSGATHLAYPTSDSDMHWSRHVGGDGIDQDCDGLVDGG